MKLDKEGGFIGRDALAAIVEKALRTDDVVDAATWEIEISGTRYAATASLSPMYDPKMEKIRC